MRIIDRYILSSVIKTFLGCLFLFFFIYIIIDAFAHLDEILRQKIGILALQNYYLSYLPIIFIRTSPIACLLATTYTLSRFNANNEIIAMRSAGLSIWQITRSTILFGLLISFLVFFVNDRYVPKAQAQTEKMQKQMFDRNTQEKEEQIIKDMTIYGFKNRLFHINSFNSKTNTMEGVTILEHDENQNLLYKIIASKGIWTDKRWRFYQYTKFEFDSNAQLKNEPIYNEEEIMDIKETPQDFLSQRQRPEEMDIAQLKNYLFRLSKSGATTVLRNLKVDLYAKISFPFASLVVMFLGIPLSLAARKRVAGISALGISVAISFLYYTTYAISLALGKIGALTPLLAATSTQLFFVFLAFYLIQKLP